MNMQPASAGCGLPAYVGTWMTADGTIRHELKPDGRYDEVRGGRDSSHSGHYRVQGGHIEYRDENGHIVGGDFRDGLLYQSGMVLYRPAR